MKVEELMRRAVVTVRSDDPLLDAWALELADHARAAQAFRRTANLALLKDHRVEVLKSVRRLLQELNIGEDETEILGELSAMLGASSFPPAR